MSDTVYAVHTTRPDDLGAVEIVFTCERQARAYAKDRSTDWRVVAAGVTRYVVGQLGDAPPGRLVHERHRAAAAGPTAGPALPDRRRR